MTFFKHPPQISLRCGVALVGTKSIPLDCFQIVLRNTSTGRPSATTTRLLASATSAASPGWKRKASAASKRRSLWCTWCTRHSQARRCIAQCSTQPFRSSSLLGALHNVFVHANASLAGGVERAVRTVFVTPDLHRVHHSADASDAHHNFGIVFSCWDRLWRTWRTPLGSGPRRFGIGSERDPARLSLPRLLWMPFRRAG